MSQSQYEEYFAYKPMERLDIDRTAPIKEQMSQLYKELTTQRGGHTDELYSRTITLKAEIDALKKENDIIWKKYIDDVAELKIQLRKAQQYTS